MASGISAKHGLLRGKTSLYKALHRKVPPGSVWIQKAADIQNVRAATSATADSRVNEKYCLELVRWVR